MRRATTPTHVFTFPSTVNIATVTEAELIYGQDGKKILTKTLSDLTPDPQTNSFSIKLTQDETSLFAPGKALAQMRVKAGGTYLASQEVWIQVKPVLNSEVL